MSSVSTSETASSNLTIRVVTSEPEILAIYGVRTVVFVDEQAVPPEEELDAYDEVATHFAVTTPDATDLPHAIIATARLVDKGSGTGKVGRVAVLKPYRGKGIGFALMTYIHTHAAEAGYRELILEAQLHALPFYEKLGYAAEGGIFMDAGIEHKLMRHRL